MPLFSIPLVPGVPALPDGPFDLIEEPPLLLDDTIGGSQDKPAWGLYQGGAPIITAESVVTLAYRKDFYISDFPVEEGGFGTYNKVSAPFDIRIRFAAGADDNARQDLIDSIDSAAETLDLYTVVTPEKTYVDVNITHVDYRRSNANGVGLLIVDVYCLEVRVSGSTAFSQTAAPSGANPINGGQVQPQAATPAQEAFGLGAS